MSWDILEWHGDWFFIILRSYCFGIVSKITRLHSLISCQMLFVVTPFIRCFEEESDVSIVKFPVKFSDTASETPFFARSKSIWLLSFFPKPSPLSREATSCQLPKLRKERRNFCGNWQKITFFGQWKSKKWFEAYRQGAGLKYRFLR